VAARSAFIFYLLMGCVLAPAACSPDHTGDPRKERLELLLSGKAGPDADRRAVSQRLNEFLQAAASGSAAIGDFLDFNLTLMDADAPPRLTAGKRPMPDGYFGAVARLSGKNYVRSRSTVRVYSEGYAVGVIYPDAEKPIVTSWKRHDDSWIISYIYMNASDKTVQSWMGLSVGR
jgi:hypothetical protein